jgi:hypothetical protein
MDVELLWFSGCPTHEAAERMLRDVLDEHGLDDVPIHRVQVEDEATGIAVRFPGSPTIRIDGKDIEPEPLPSADYSPRCRLYFTSTGLSGLPERAWVETAVAAAVRQ